MTQRRPWWGALLLSRALIWVTAVAAVGVLGLAEHAAYDPDGLTTAFGDVGDALSAPAARWDATWYLNITEHGYGDDAARPAFFPLYPLLVALVSAVVREPVIAGVLVSMACLAGALLLLYRLTAFELGERAAVATTWLVAFGPMAFFFSAVYSEALFLVLSIGAMLSARRERWVMAGVLALLAALTRSAGVLLVIPLVVLAWTSGKRRNVAWALLALAGPAVFALYLELAGGGWLSPFEDQKLWGREFAGPFVAVVEGASAAAHGARDVATGEGGSLPFQNLLFFAFLVVAIPCVVGVFRRLPLAYGLYTVAALALPLSYPVDGRPLLSLPRFVTVVYPLWMWLGWWVVNGDRWRAWVVGGTCVAALVTFTAMFSTWHFVS